MSIEDIKGLNEMDRIIYELFFLDNKGKKLIKFEMEQAFDQADINNLSTEKLAYYEGRRHFIRMIRSRIKDINNHISMQKEMQEDNQPIQNPL